MTVWLCIEKMLITQYLISIVMTIACLFLIEWTHLQWLSQSFTLGGRGAGLRRSVGHIRSCTTVGQPMLECWESCSEELRNNLAEPRNEDAVSEDATASAPAWCSAKRERPCAVAAGLVAGTWNEGRPCLCRRNVNRNMSYELDFSYIKEKKKKETKQKTKTLRTDSNNKFGEQTSDTDDR